MFNNKILKKTCVVLLSVLLLIIGGVFCYTWLQPFSKSTSAMAKAEESVVKIYCYDINGNEIATGSGFVAFNEKTCITNYHVLTDAYTYKISTSEDITLLAEGIITCSEEKDIAIIQLQKDTNLKPLKIGNSSEIKKGETVTAIGSPLGIKNTLSQGILSGRLMLNNMDVLQITAPISGGSSGGALFNGSGEVVGVTFASYEAGQNLNLAIPINEVNHMYESAGTLKEVNHVFLESHPEHKYLDTYSHIKTVSIDEIKKDPKMYDGKFVRIVAAASSVQEYDGQLAFISREGFVSGDYSKDNSTYVNNDFEKNPLIEVISGTECDYSQRNLSAGDTVVVIGEFTYHEKGEKIHSYFTTTHTYGRIRAMLVYTDS